MTLDGTTVTASGTSYAINTGGTPMIGNCSAGYYFDGTLDDVRVYARVLSSAEISALDDVQSVSVAATVSQASELGDTGDFTVTRTAVSTSLPLIVRYNTNGSTATGQYEPLSGIVTIPAGQTSATITVTPINSAITNGGTVIVNLLADDDGTTQYNLTGTTSTTVNLVPFINEVARWKFDETSGTTASDSSGNGLTGTLQNGTTFVGGHMGNGVSILASNQDVALPDSISLISGRKRSVLHLRLGQIRQQRYEYHQ